MSEYQYKPLSANYIRLIQLLPDLDGNAPVRCQLLEYPIHMRKIGSHIYDALSYVWGPPPNTCHVEVVDGSECSVLSIRENCHVALVRLRDPILPRFVWVDSICINQEDNKEKTQQVRMMTGIYALASRVVVWLREPQEVGSIMDNGRGLEFIRRAAGHCAWSTMITDHDINLELEPQDAKDIMTVLKRSWFRRIWVLQEVAAAREVVMMDGLHEVHGYAFSFGLDVLRLKTESLPWQEETMRRAHRISTLMMGTRLRTRTPSTHDIALDQFTLGLHTLPALIDMFHDHDATDRRDKIFALLGMGSDVPIGFSANYDMTWSQVFHKLTRALLIGDEHSALTHLETWDDQEIAVMRTKILVLGRVIEAESTRETNGVQLGMIKWRSEQDTYTLGDRLSNCAAKSIRKNDLVCMFPAARLPSIVRPVYTCNGAGLSYLFIIAATMNNMTEWGKATDNPVPTWCDTSASITDSPSAWVGCRAVWDWGISRENMTYETSIPSERTQLHLELMAESGLIWEAPETLQDRISTLEDFGEILTRAESHHAASEVFSTLIDLYLSVTGCNSPEFVAVTEKMRQLHQKTNNRHYKDNCLWKIEAITRTGRGMKVTPRTLVDIQAVKATSIADPDEHRKLKDWCKYRAEDVRRSITPQVLGNIVNQPGRRTIGPVNWVLDCLRPDDVQVVRRFLADNSCWEGFHITPNRVDFQVALYLKWKMECITGSIDPETLHKFKTLKAATEDVFHQASCLSLEQVEFVLDSLRDLIPALEKQQLFTKAAHWGERDGARKQMELILDKWDDVVITEDVISKAVEVAFLVGTKLEDRLDEYLVLPLLVERCGDLHLFISRCGEPFPINARVLVELASKIRGPRLLSVFERLLTLFDNSKAISKNSLRSVDVKRLIIAAAANKLYGKDLVKMVLCKYIDNTVIGPQALRRAWITNEHSKDAMFKLLEERIGKPWVEKVEELREKQWIRGDQYSEGVISLLIKYAMSKLAAG